MVSVFDFQPCPRNRDEIYGGAPLFFQVVRNADAAFRPNLMDDAVSSPRYSPFLLSSFLTRTSTKDEETKRLANRIELL